MLNSRLAAAAIKPSTIPASTTRGALICQTIASVAVSTAVVEIGARDDPRQHDRLYVADSEGSSIRAVPLKGKKKVKTIVGTAHLSGARLFTFGDTDGPLGKARLQHCLEVVWHDGRLYVADTYNNKVKVVDLDQGTCTTLVGDGEAGADDEPARFNEPAGLAYADGKLFVADTNNHAVRVIHLADGNRVTTLSIDGLTPPRRERPPRQFDFAGATEIKLEPARVGLLDADGDVDLVTTISGSYAGAQVVAASPMTLARSQ